jgi:hypothetical protein
MAYIGKQPIVGNFVKLDAITTSATATYNLLNGGVAYFPQTANNCLVSLNGILQAPTDSYTISGSTIIFSNALTTSDVIDFIIVLGDVLNIGTPSDNTVSLAKLTATGTKNSTTFLRGDNTFASAGGDNTPAFRAKRTTSQTSIADTTYVKVQINTEDYDTNSNYDNATNYRFTPTTAGKYFFTANVSMGGSTNDVKQFLVTIRKNGTNAISSDTDRRTAGIGYNATEVVCGVIEANGSTDYFEVFVYRNAGGTVDLTNAYFEAFKLIGV